VLRLAETLSSVLISTGLSGFSKSRLESFAQYGIVVEGRGDLIFGGAVAASMGGSKHLDKCEYTVWYGTNRRPHDTRDLSKAYSADRGDRIHYGNCRVYIPKAHKIGSVRSPWWKRLVTRTDDRLKLIGLQEFDVAHFWQQLGGQLGLVSASSCHFRAWL
jgi:hypothetical protein